MAGQRTLGHLGPLVVATFVYYINSVASQSNAAQNPVNYGYSARLVTNDTTEAAQTAPLGTLPPRGCNSPGECRSLCPATKFSDLPAGAAGFANVPQQVGPVWCYVMEC